jgi:Protein of unknown function (DUF2442)
MKLKDFEHCDAYRFLLTFENGEVKEADLFDLIGHHVSLDALNTARIDPEWGCLEFNNGMVDVEPKTLYKFASAAHFERAA